ncbi:Crp/Fnr family transcriptional regulator [Actibacterium sp. XHP0104]|uniref:Crp/Fnr family transcriptional regulator n=1 Tax=Actibacterium sp. XHP0104 TaxID=2984335 RepID=UPI0021E6F4E9|nr:Crp/Fnr family transcriptional regulator [Actibacterium sp. XHP0104]MCV2882368.1 Crp/Fnr family transcriptional regulator [Actibacterium sp. XHP0104]
MPPDTEKSEATYLAGPLFAAFSEKGRQELLARGVMRDWARGETVFLRGDPGDYFVYVQDGIAEVSITSLNGRKSVLNHMRAGEILGEVALLDGGPRSADVVAHSRLRGIVVQRQQVLQYLGETPEAAIEMIEHLCGKVRNASDMFETHSMTSAAARLARCVLQFARKWGATDAEGHVTITQKFSQSDLGEFSGLARENVNRYISAWAREGIIGFDRGRITLFDPDRLHDLAEY